MALINKDKKKEIQKAIGSGDTSKIKEVKKFKPLVETGNASSGNLSAPRNVPKPPAAQSPDQMLRDAILDRNVNAAKDAIAQGAKLDPNDKEPLLHAASSCDVDALEILVAASAVDKDKQAELLSSILLKETLPRGNTNAKDKASKLLGKSEPEVQNGVLEKCMHHEKNYTLAEWAANAVKKLPKEQRHSLVGACVSSNWMAPRDIGLEIALELPLESQRFDVIKTVIGPLHERHLGVNLPLLLRLVDSCGSYHDSSLANALIETARVYFSSIPNPEYEKFNKEFTKKVAIRISLWADVAFIRKDAISRMGCLDDEELAEALSSPYSDVKWAARKKQLKNSFW